MIFEIGDWWPYSYYFVGYCFQELFNIARSILVQLPSNFFSVRVVSVQVMNLYSSMNTAAAWKKLCFILSDRSDFHKTDSLPTTVHAFASRVLISAASSPLKLSFHPFSSFVAPGRFFRLHPVSAQSWCKSLLLGQHYYDHEFVLTLPAIYSKSCSSNLDGLWDRWLVAILLLFCGLLLPGFLQNNT